MKNCTEKPLAKFRLEINLECNVSNVTWVEIKHSFFFAIFYNEIATYIIFLRYRNEF